MTQSTGIVIGRWRCYVQAGSRRPSSLALVAHLRRVDQVRGPCPDITALSDSFRGCATQRRLPDGLAKPCSSSVASSFRNARGSTVRKAPPEKMGARHLQNARPYLISEYDAGDKEIA